MGARPPWVEREVLGRSGAYPKRRVPHFIGGGQPTSPDEAQGDPLAHSRRILQSRADQHRRVGSQVSGGHDFFRLPSVRRRWEPICQSRGQADVDHPAIFSFRHRNVSDRVRGRQWAFRFKGFHQESCSGFIVHIVDVFHLSMRSRIQSEDGRYL